MIDHANYAYGTPEASRARIHELACWAAIQAEIVVQCCELSDDSGTAYAVRRLTNYTKALIEAVCDQHEENGRDSK